jgi:hypothetical protein
VNAASTVSARNGDMGRGMVLVILLQGGIRGGHGWRSRGIAETGVAPRARENRLRAALGFPSSRNGIAVRSKVRIAAASVAQGVG